VSFDRLTKEQMIALPFEEYERRYPSTYASIANEVARSMNLHELVWSASKGCCKALPALVGEDFSRGDCDVDGGCDRHRESERIGDRLLRLRARVAS